MTAFDVDHYLRAAGEYDNVASAMAHVLVHGAHFHWWAGTYPPMSMDCWLAVISDHDAFDAYVRATAFALAMTDVMEEL